MTPQVAELGIAATTLVDTLIDCGVTHAVWLVDSESGALWQALVAAERQGRLATIPICREGEAIPVGLGLLMGGKRPVIIIQNTGFFESGDSLRGQAIDFELPLVMLIGYRGWKADKASMNDSAGIYLEPVLDAYGVPHKLLEGPKVRQLIPEAYAEAERRQGPVALLVPAEWEAGL